MGFFVGGIKGVELGIPGIVPNSQLIVETWLKKLLIINYLYP